MDSLYRPYCTDLLRVVEINKERKEKAMGNLQRKKDRIFSPMGLGKTQMSPVALVG